MGGIGWSKLISNLKTYTIKFLLSVRRPDFICSFRLRKWLFHYIIDNYRHHNCKHLFICAANVIIFVILDEHGKHVKVSTAILMGKISSDMVLVQLPLSALATLLMVIDQEVGKNPSLITQLWNKQKQSFVPYAKSTIILTTTTIVLFKYFDICNYSLVSMSDLRLGSLQNLRSSTESDTSCKVIF